LDLSTGASGDKLFGALLELCEKRGLTSFEELERRAQQLLPKVTLLREQVERAGVAATHLTVEAGHNQHHRHWVDIRELIAAAATEDIINQNVAKLATRAFERVAQAEAKVHGIDPDQVHFHEVGADDSIIDIIFNSFLLDKLNPTAVYATPLALGSGTVLCEHGELPVPAPATAEILANSQVPAYTSSHDGELTTPTGAALIAEFVTAFAPLPCSQPLACGYGAGSRELPGAANILRAICADPVPFAGLKAREEEQLCIEGVTLLACNLDHLTPEAAAFACEELLAAGALDVWQEPITMKKGRLASKLVVLTRPEQATALAQRIIELTGSLGVRSTYCERTVIPRAVRILDTPYGPVPFKAAEVGTPAERTYWLRPEHDTVARLARERGLNYLDLYAELQELADSHH